jgi:hypothetical protein
MLTCVYHPIDDFRVVEKDEADCLMATGCWFDSPQKAQEYRLKVEDEIKAEEKAKASTPKAKTKGKSDER